MTCDLTVSRFSTNRTGRQRAICYPGVILRAAGIGYRRIERMTGINCGLAHYICRRYSNA